MKIMHSLATGWKKTVHFSLTHATSSGNKPGVHTGDVDLFARQTQTSSPKRTTSSENIKVKASLTPLSQSPEREKACSELEGLTCLELIPKARDLVLNAIWGEGHPYAACQLLSQIIYLYPDSTSAYIMRSVVRAKLGNLKEAIEDCDAILCRNPDNEFALLHRVSFLQDSRIRTTSSEGIKKVLRGVKFAKEMGNTPYSIVLKHAGMPRLKPDQAHIEEIQNLVTAAPSYRCAKVVLTGMYFARWLYTGDKSCEAEAVRLAIEVQKDWPDDKTAMSVLWYLQGNLGQGSLLRSNPRGYDFILQDSLYPKQMIRADVLFCFPLEDQDKSVKQLIERIASLEIDKDGNK